MPVSRTSDRFVILGATAASGLAAALGLGWLLRPRTASFYDAPENAMLATIAGPGVATVVHTVIALLGLAAGIAALAGLAGRTAVIVVAALHVVSFGVLLGSMGTLSVAGYLVAMAMPIVLVVLLVQVVRRYRIARWTIGIPGLLALSIGTIAGRDTLLTLTTNLGGGIAREAGKLAMILLLLGIGALWALALVRAASGSPSAERATAWVTRHRRMFTVIAAIGPLPYALVRLTWLTPWPAHIADPSMLDLSTRIWGLALSSGAWLGCVLTIGLIRPWGETFPRWMPGLAGRPVPIAAAAVPGGLVAAVVCFTAFPMLHTASTRGAAELVQSALTFPCWFWGPALALAVWGYVGHRRASEPVQVPPRETALRSR